MAATHKGLGRGLDALITSKDISEGILMVEIKDIEPNVNQPRKSFSEESLAELADSIREHGVLQPLLVRKEENGSFKIIAGERRWRAARIAKLRKVPVIVKDVTDEEILELALIENLHREDLNPIEEAICYRRLIDEFMFTQERISEKIGKSKSAISYALSLLNLDQRVQDLVMEGALTAGHAKAVLKHPFEKQLEVAEAIKENGMSVREAEIYQIPVEPVPGEEGEKVPPKEFIRPSTVEFKTLETNLRERYGT
ncbi:MAG: ParB/RepB/Spo0J family partition protein, partial [Clostridiales bacterium]|nr:ParB/RepB/Spo0J family partition protein [Clostridiales bacterium]